MKDSMRPGSQFELDMTGTKPRVGTSHITKNTESRGFVNSSEQTKHEIDVKVKHQRTNKSFDRPVYTRSFPKSLAAKKNY